MNVDADVEHICLFSEEQEDTGAGEKISEYRFDQSSRLHHCEAHFEVFNTHYVQIQTRGLSKQARTYDLDLTFLDPVPRRSRRIDWPLAWTSAILAGAAALTATLAPASIPASVLVMIVAAMLMGSVISLLLLVRRYRDLVIFCSRHGRWPLLTLLNRNPSPEQLQSFVDKLSERIRQTRDNRPDKQQFLCAELCEHRRLRDEGILKPEKYDAIRQRILSQHAQPG